MSTYRKFISEMYIHGYSPADGEPTFRVPENFDRYNEGPGWQAYRGANDWENGTTGIAVYLNPEGYNKEMARIWFEVQYPKDIEEAVHTSKAYHNDQSKAVEKWGKRAAVRWVRETARIRKETKLLHGPHDGYNHNWIQRKTWRECFILALQSERMKPFVKKYGVDHTKWVGMKRTVNEHGIPSKYWWMDKDGNLIPVPNQNHAPRGLEILKTKHGVTTPDPKTVYRDMYALGYLRIGFAGLMGAYEVEVTYDRNRPPSAKQWRSMKDLAIEMGAESVLDKTSGNELRVDESKMLQENFHENKEWFIYEGAQTVTAVFGDNSRQTFKVHFHDNRGEDRDKHKAKAARTWKRLAMEIRKTAGLNEVGNPIEIPWQQCFEQALKHPEMQQFVDDMRATPIFEFFRPAPLMGAEQPLNEEMTYQELRDSMKNYRIRRGGGGKTVKVGDNGREERAGHVRVRPLRIISTVGRDRQERETSTFSYKSDPAWRTNGAAGHGHQGYIRYLSEHTDNGVVSTGEPNVEVNCTCEDYRFVWAKANNDKNAGPTSRDGALDGHSFSQFKGGENNNDGTHGQRIRNPANVPGLCKHLLSLAEYLEKNTGSSPVAQGGPEDKGPSPVSKNPTKPKKPVNIFENIKAFAVAHPQFDVQVED